jgi:hypothetical protein
MAEVAPSKEVPRLSERIETYREEAQSLVRQGGEQPRFEFKRSVSLIRENLDDRLDFIKFVQGVANSLIVGEHCIVIGADAKEKRIGAAWGKYFGSLAKFAASSAQLEFLLEFNSYFGTNTLKDPKLQQWLPLNIENTSFDYFPDLYNQDLQAAVPMAERIYDILSSPNPLFPVYLAVDVRIFARVFADTQPGQRLALYAGFLHHLKKWQEETMFRNFRRFPFMYTWQGRLGEIVAECENKQRSIKS